MKSFFKLSALSLLMTNGMSHAVVCSNGITASDIAYIHIAAPTNIDDNDYNLINIHNMNSFVSLRNGIQFRPNFSNNPNQKNALYLNVKCPEFSGRRLSELPESCELFLYKDHTVNACKCNASGCVEYVD